MGMDALGVVMVVGIECKVSAHLWAEGSEGHQMAITGECKLGVTGSLARFGRYLETGLLFKVDNTLSQAFVDLQFKQSSLFD